MSARRHNNHPVVLFPIDDIHTHHLTNLPGAVVSGDPDRVARWIAQHPDGLFSVGIHPWNSLEAASGNNSADVLAALKAVASQPQVVAIGEAGLDTLRGAPLPVQEQLLRRHIALSEELHKPLVLHTVHAFDRMLGLRREYGSRLSQPWIFHGFRGKPQLASQLLASGTARSPVFLSLGERFNPLAARIIPAGSILAETDESPLPVHDIVERIAAARGEAPVELQGALRSNVRRIIGSGTE